jgi:molybdate transport system substrate-binding protein
MARFGSRRDIAKGFAALVVACLSGMTECHGESTSSAAQRQILVAAAADLKFAFDDLASEFQAKNPGIKLTVTYDSSGNFYAQLSNRAPFDLFLSADITYPSKLADAGLALKESLFVYAVGRIVVWVPKRSTLDLDRLGIKAVTDPSVKKLAIANPRHAPYGRAAEAALKKSGVFDAVKDRLVLGENIAQTAQFVESGSADVGIIALSLALAPKMRDKGRYWALPLNLYPPLEQAGVIMAWAKDKDATRALRDFMTAREGQAILKRYGFMLRGD